MDEIVYRAQPWAINLFLHNWPVMLYSVLVLWAGARAYLRPSRPAVLLLYGALVLVLAFEYAKHGLVVVRDTTAYLFVDPPLRQMSQFFLIDVLPLAIYALGIALVFISVVWHAGGGIRSGSQRDRPRREPLTP